MCGMPWICLAPGKHGRLTQWETGFGKLQVLEVPFLDNLGLREPRWDPRAEDPSPRTGPKSAGSARACKPASSSMRTTLRKSRLRPGRDSYLLRGGNNLPRVPLQASMAGNQSPTSNGPASEPCAQSQSSGSHILESPSPHGDRTVPRARAPGHLKSI